MSSKNQIVRINLTKTQKDQIKKETGMEAEAFELKADELEERIAPFRMV